MSGSITNSVPFIRLHAQDDVLIARQQLIGGTQVEQATVKGLIPAGHKVAAHDIASGAPIRRYNQIIGLVKKKAALHVTMHFAQMYNLSAQSVLLSSWVINAKTVAWQRVITSAYCRV